jgi:glycosyltransferase involved in cell wall biosynthesis
MKLSVIIPVYNEKPTIIQIVRAVKAADLPGVEKEIIVVDDGSDDGTREALSCFERDRFVRVFFQSPNQGKTAAIRRGLKESSGDLILIQDADLEYSPSHYPALLEPILKGEADVIYGSRFLGRITGMAPLNRFANAVSNLTFNLFFKARLTDINTCFKVFRKSDLNRIVIESDRFAFETEVTAKLARRGLRFREVPIVYQARSVKQGKKISWRSALGMYWAILKYRFA